MSQLLFNITLIISFMFAASIVREQIIYRVEGIKRYKMYRLIYYGCSYGLLGSILMIYTIRIDSTIILDLRFLAVTEVAKIAKSVVFDESAFVARYGGEEFGILLPRANQYEAIKMAEAIRQQVEQRGIVHQASEVFKCVTISVGIMTVVPSENIRPISIVHQADQALYEAKCTGRNRISVYSHHKEADSNV
ncbi:diguanylate cyclase domain-containing protein [Priestia aryabhattai]|uniref:diguanylate cyclase domain-containing protein n=2 Tax=Priestia TaxID=2800373 RepID=UPI000942945B